MSSEKPPPPAIFCDGRPTASRPVRGGRAGSRLRRPRGRQECACRTWIERRTMAPAFGEISQAVRRTQRNCVCRADARNGGCLPRFGEEKAMTLTITCPGCHSPLQVRAEYAGKQLTCPRCAGVISVPAGSGGTAEAAPAVLPVEG